MPKKKQVKEFLKQPQRALPCPRREERDLLEVSALELARKIREGARTATEVVQAHIARIRAVNGRLNAVVQDRFEEALKEAQEKDAKLKRLRKESVERGTPLELPILYGVPFTVKECFAVRGFPQTSGVVARRNAVPEDDAPAVSRMKRAGGVLLGVTNVPELCLWVETTNKLYGRTCNPYHAEHIVGGSSGGEGAIIGAGGSPLGIGSDIGGSIRYPAFCNGVFGHKPTGGLIPTTGQFPIPGEHPKARRMLTTGPLARRATDIYPVLKLLAGPDGQDPGCLELPIQDPCTVSLNQLAVYLLPGDGLTPLSPEVVTVQKRAAAHLAARGARVETLTIRSFRKALGLWGATLALTSSTEVAQLLSNGVPLSFAKEFAKLFFTHSPYTLPPLFLALAQKGEGRAIRALFSKYAQAAEVLKEKLVRFLSQNSVLLFPPSPRPVPRHNETFRHPLDLMYTAIFNVLEFPVTEVPIPHRGRLPLGVQVAAAPGCDHLTLAVASALEEIGGWTPPWKKPLLNSPSKR